MSDMSSDKGVAICRDGMGNTACSMDEDSDMSGDERGMLSTASEQAASASSSGVPPGGPTFKVRYILYQHREASSKKKKCPLFTRN